MANYNYITSISKLMKHFYQLPTAIKPGQCPSKVIEKHFGDIAPLTSKGSYSMWVHCGFDPQGATNDDVYMVVYGVKGHSKPFHLNKGSQFKAGAIVQLTVSNFKFFKILFYCPLPFAKARDIKTHSSVPLSVTKTLTWLISS